ncbi:MAG: HD-GYP domain-containing protein [Actinobacteria bacterium]|nr:HD-GYP domain-containing protein [Actinomycetota bacterium]
MTDEAVRATASGDEGHRWQGRPWIARAVRALVVVVPFASSVAVAFVLSQLLPAAPGPAWLVARLIGIAAVATVALRLVDRVMRRLLPLATLLDLTLLFPDQAPSRYRMALRGGASNVELQERIDRYTRSGESGTASAAEHLLDLVAALSRHDRITRGHSERVRAYAQMIGEEMGLSGHELDRLRWAALIHDVGKLRVPTEILNKPGKLTDEEFAVIKLHPEMGARLAAPLAAWLGDSVLAVVEHHEKWDGTGYPKGLRGTEISQAGRIVAVADVFDVLTSARSYKSARSAVTLSLGRLRFVMAPLSWLAHLSLFPQALLATAAPAAGATAATAPSVAAAAMGVVATGMGAMAMPVAAGQELRPPPAVEVAFDSNSQAGTVSELGAPVTVAPLDGASIDDVLAGGVAQPSDAFGLSGASTEDVAPPDPTTTTTIATATAVDPASSGALSGTSNVVPGSSGQKPGISGETPGGGAAQATPTPAVETTAVAPAPTPTTAAPAPAPAATAAPTPTTAAPTTVPAPTTTVVPEISSAYYLFASPAAGDTASQELLPTAQRLPQQWTLPNYDVDRDGAPGLTILRGGALATGDPVRMQRFSVDPATDLNLRGRHQVHLWVAPAAGVEQTLNVTVALTRCNDDRTNCSTMSTATGSAQATAGSFELLSVDFGRLTQNIPAAQHLEVWIVTDGSSTADLVLAYDASIYGSGLQITR